MTALESLRKEWKAEYETTKKFLELYPNAKNDFKVHPKSYSLQHLTTHIINIFSWPEMVIKVSTLDMAGGEPPAMPKNKKEMLAALDAAYKTGSSALKKAKEEDMKGSWTLAAGKQKLHRWPSKYDALRHAMSQIIHHRAQLGVNYRLLNIKLPNAYGPTADTSGF